MRKQQKGIHKKPPAPSLKMHKLTGPMTLGNMRGLDVHELAAKQ